LFIHLKLNIGFTEPANNLLRKKCYRYYTDRILLTLFISGSVISM